MLSRLRVGQETLDMDHTDPQGFDCRSSSDFRELPLWTLAANVLNSRGLRHETSGRFLEARADYERAIEISPGYANAYNNRGNMKLRGDDPQGAIADYTEAIRLHPTFAEAHCNRGMAWQKLGRFREARDDYTRALSLDSGYGDASRRLALLGDIEFREPAVSRTSRRQSASHGARTPGPDDL
jgi:tetratricopeptide (TPR) repeat protein